RRQKRRRVRDQNNRVAATRRVGARSARGLASALACPLGPQNKRRRRRGDTRSRKPRGSRGAAGRRAARENRVRSSSWLPLAPSKARPPRSRHRAPSPCPETESSHGPGQTRA
ncbi:unnamed protein product, partial [Ixodes persulcatus]